MNRKEAIAEYKNRKTPRGTFAVRFADDGPAWVDSTPDLVAMRNRTLGELRSGAHRNIELQAEWNTHGEAEFRYEVLETLEDDLATLVWRDQLKDKKKEWLAKRGARQLYP